MNKRFYNTKGGREHLVKGEMYILKYNNTNLIVEYIGEHPSNRDIKDDSRNYNLFKVIMTSDTIYSIGEELVWNFCDDGEMFTELN